MMTVCDPATRYVLLVGVATVRKDTLTSKAPDQKVQRAELRRRLFVLLVVWIGHLNP